MVNTRQLGARYENLAKKELEKQGWTVYRVPGSTQWSKSVDIFHLFDLFCVRYGKYRLIQIKLNKKPPMGPYDEFWEENKCNDLDIECWAFWGKGKRKSKQGWEKIKWSL